MNWLGLAAVVLGFVLFWIGVRLARRQFAAKTELLFIAMMMMAAIPGWLYALYYTKLLGEPIWLYGLRAVPGSELFATPSGLLAGWMHVRWVPRMRLSAPGRKFLFPILLGIGLTLPYLKPLLRPLPTKEISDQWRGAACIQSTPSTCGPASAATILHHFGQHGSERELAAEAFTSSSGTENWYLARALRRRGMETSFRLGSPMEVPLPAIAGVRLVNVENTGHFIALIDREGDKLIFNDPMEGFSTNTMADLKGQYDFTGFFLVVQAGEARK